MTIVNLHHASDVRVHVAQTDKHSVSLAYGSCHVLDSMRPPLRIASFLLRAAVDLPDDRDVTFPAGESGQP